MKSKRPFQRLRRNGPAVGPNERLEKRLAFSVSTTVDADDMDQSKGFPHAPRSSCSCPGCSFVVPAEILAAPTSPNAQFPLSETFKLHSLPSATKRVYLDFDGHLTDKTLWQTYFGHGPINTPAFSLDTDYSNFSDLEKETIQDVWARVTEDFAPFEIDVTTEDPGIDALVNSGGSDTAWGIRVVIGGDGAWKGSAGVAVFNGFGEPGGAPAFAFADQAWKTIPNVIATCVSHEVGHTLGLSHDGHNGSEYYGGRGTGPTSWGPLMGNPNTSLTQWSKGDYGGATRSEDDLDIIAKRTGNGFGYRADDHGNSLDTATAPIVDVTRGIIERNDDQDLFRFTSAGTIKASVKPIAVGANLDVLAEILDSNGVVLHTSNPIGQIDASFDVTVSPGTYYLRVQGTGEGDPLQTGYTKYGSLGQYTVTIQNVIPPPVVSIADVVSSEGDTGETIVQFTVSLSKAAVQPVSVKVATRDGTATAADKDYVPIVTAETLVFAAGESTKQFAVRVKGDRWFEEDESFSIVLSSPEGVAIGDGEAIGTILNDDSDVPVLSIADTVISEGNAGRKMVRVSVMLSKPSTSLVAVSVRTEDGTATTVDNDYLPLPFGTRVVLPPGQTISVVEVPIIGDRRFEEDEWFNVTLSDAEGTVIATQSARVLLSNDDRDPATLPRLTLFPAVAVEASNGRAATFTMRVSGNLTEPVTLSYVTLDGSARGRMDYRPSRGTLQILPGQSEARVAVAVFNDRLPEQDETFSLKVSAPATANIIVLPWTTELTEQTIATAPAIILDDDSRFFTLQTVNSTIATGSAFEFQVALHRRAGHGEALPSFTEFGTLPASFLEAMASQVRFTASFMSGHAPTATRPRRPKLGAVDFHEGSVSLGYVANESGAITTKLTETLEIQTDLVARRRSLTVQLFNPTNAMLNGMSVVRATVTPPSAAGFASLASPASAPRSRRK